jgi:hypothetical protein
MRDGSHESTASRGQEIQSNARLGVERISCRNRVERTAQTAYDIAEQKIYLSRVFERIAEVGAFNTVSRDAAAIGELVRSPQPVLCPGRAVPMSEQRLEPPGVPLPLVSSSGRGEGTAAALIDAA